MSTMAVEPSIPALPTGVLGNPPATDLGAAEAFSLAIQLAMGVVATVPTTPVTEDGTEPTDAQTTDEESTTDPDEVGETGEAGAALAAFLVPTLLPVPTASIEAEAPATDQPIAVDATTTSPTTGAQPTTDSAQAETQPGTPDQSQDHAPDAPPAAQAPVAAAPETASPAPSQSAPQVTTVTQVAGPADASGTPAPRAVASQVIPEVTKLFSNGEGVHRVTLELNPKALGEVRVVLTVRHGDVHVRLAAGSEAREALAMSSADLNRALEHIGIKDHKLTLSELPGVAASASTQTFSDTTEQRDQNASFTGRFDTEQHHDSRHSRMGDGSTATDGTDHEHGSRTRGNRSIHEVSHVPSRGGVDLRM